MSASANPETMCLTRLCATISTLLSQQAREPGSELSDPFAYRARSGRHVTVTYARGVTDQLSYAEARQYLTLLQSGHRGKWVRESL